LIRFVYQVGSVQYSGVAGKAPHYVVVRTEIPLPRYDRVTKFQVVLVADCPSLDAAEAAFRLLSGTATKGMRFE
jgi:hypothetical protein